MKTALLRPLLRRRATSPPTTASPSATPPGTSPTGRAASPARARCPPWRLMDARSIAATAANGGVLTGAEAATSTYTVPDEPTIMTTRPIKARVYHGFGQGRAGGRAGLRPQHHGLAGARPPCRRTSSSRSARHHHGPGHHHRRAHPLGRDLLLPLQPAEARRSSPCPARTRRTWAAPKRCRRVERPADRRRVQLTPSWRPCAGSHDPARSRWTPEAAGDRLGALRQQARRRLRPGAGRLLPAGAGRPVPTSPRSTPPSATAPT